MDTEPTFTPPPSDPQPIPPRLTGAFCGVAIPDDITVFDCRVPESVPLAQTASPWGELIYSRGGYALGITRGWGSSPRYPVAIEARHIDNREPREVQSVARMFRRILDMYREATVDGKRPRAIEIDNYGMTVIAERRDYR